MYSLKQCLDIDIANHDYIELSANIKILPSNVRMNDALIRCLEK